MTALDTSKAGATLLIVPTAEDGSTLAEGFAVVREVQTRINADPERVVSIFTVGEPPAEVFERMRYVRDVVVAEGGHLIVGSGGEPPEELRALFPHVVHVRTDMRLVEESALEREAAAEAAALLARMKTAGGVH
jgi:hypothetical protein